MPREFRNIHRPTTTEEKERFAKVLAEIVAEVPELKKWARDAAARHPERIGTKRSKADLGKSDDAR